MISHEKYDFLINAIGEIDGVVSIGKSGGKSIPQNNESDIDIFVFCNKFPEAQTRKSAVKKLEFFVSDMKFSEKTGRFWGSCDFMTVEGTEICLMYFNVADMNDEIESILNGSRLDRESEYFYPIGRCASFLSMYILYDETGYISNMQKKLSVYPLSLAEKLYHHHIHKINEAEDFERAVLRCDVLFYHATLELATDHFLQALFALNRCYFPSRKRTSSRIYSRVTSRNISALQLPLYKNC